MKQSLKIMKILLSLTGIVMLFALIGLPALVGTAGIILAFPILLASYETSDEAKQKLLEVYEKMERMVDQRKSEKRTFTDQEDKEYKELRSDYDALNKHVKELESDEKRRLDMAKMQGKRSQEEAQKAEIGKYSLKRAMQFAMSGRTPDGLEGEMHEEAETEARNNGVSINGLGIPNLVLRNIAERRAMSVTGQTTVAGDQGGMLVPTETSGLLMALRPLLVLSGLGADFMGNLVGNLEYNKGTSTSAAWNTETGTAAETNIATSQIVMSPKRLAAFLKFSRQLMIQTPENIEAKIWGDLVAAISQELERAAINGSGANNEPRGILNTSGIGSVVGGTNGAAPTWDHITALEREVDIANALMGSLGYLTNAHVKSKLKSTKVDAGSGLMVWPQNANELNGFRVASSNLVPSNLSKGTSNKNLSPIIFGDFKELKIGQWSGLDMIVDQVTLAKSGQVQIIANSFWDVAIVQPEKFAAIKDIDTGKPSVVTTTAAPTTTAAG